MKQIQTLAIALTMMLLSSVSAAATTVVVVNLQAAILGSEPAQKSLETLRKQSGYASLQAELDTLKSDLQALQKEAETNGMTWSADQKAEHRKKMESVGSDLQYTAKKMQAEQQAVMQQIMEGVEPKVKQALDEIAKEDKIDLILDSQAAYFASEKGDITRKLTEKLNKAK